MTTRHVVALSVMVLLPAMAALAAGPTRIVTVTAGELPGEISGDFGEVLEGEAVTLQLVITNPGSEPLQIGAVRPLCGCMHERSDRSVPPGGEGTVALTLETVGYAGPTTEAALIEWVGADVPVTRAEMHMTVQPVIEVVPARLVRFRTTAGRAATEKLRLRSPRGGGFQVVSVEPSADFVTAALAPADDGYTLTITVTAEAPAGLLRETVTVRTDLPTVPKLELKVTGLVRAP